ncbi:MAG: hypothetical protein QXP49_01105 [Nitrososphaerota archaeon]
MESTAAESWALFLSEVVALIATSHHELARIPFKLYSESMSLRFGNIYTSRRTMKLTGLVWTPHRL